MFSHVLISLAILGLWIGQGSVTFAARSSVPHFKFKPNFEKPTGSQSRTFYQILLPNLQLGVPLSDNFRETGIFQMNPGGVVWQSVGGTYYKIRTQQEHNMLTGAKIIRISYGKSDASGRWFSNQKRQDQWVICSQTQSMIHAISPELAQKVIRADQEHFGQLVRMRRK